MGRTAPGAHGGWQSDAFSRPARSLSQGRWLGSPPCPADSAGRSPRSPCRCSVVTATFVTRWPSVGVVIPTRDRPAELRAALAAIEAQDYPGSIEVVVVFDQAALDESLASGRGRVRVVGNDRSPGLAGRHRGILALDTELVAFCDDDDEWLPGKLTSQVRALADRPGAEFASCGIAVRSGGRVSPRRPDLAR